MTGWTAPQALHDLAFRYAQAIDTLDADALLALFTPDGAVLGYGNNPISFRGEGELRDMIAKVEESFARTMHNVFNQLFSRAEDGSVTGLTYCIASHIIDGDEWQVLEMPLWYHNSYREVGGEWRFFERRLEVLWTATRPAQRFDPHVMGAPTGALAGIINA